MDKHVDGDYAEGDHRRTFNDEFPEYDGSGVAFGRRTTQELRIMAKERMRRKQTTTPRTYNQVADPRNTPGNAGAANNAVTVRTQPSPTQRGNANTRANPHQSPRQATGTQRTRNPTGTQRVKWIRKYASKSWLHTVPYDVARPKPSPNPIVEQGLLSDLTYPLTGPREMNLNFLRRSMSSGRRGEQTWPNERYRLDYKYWEAQAAPPGEQRRNGPLPIRNGHSEWALKNCVEFIYNHYGRRIGLDGPNQNFVGWRLCQIRDLVDDRRIVTEIIYLWHPTEWDNYYLQSEGFGNPSETHEPFKRSEFEDAPWMQENDGDRPSTAVDNQNHHQTGNDNNTQNRPSNRRQRRQRERERNNQNGRNKNTRNNNNGNY
eukprot:233911_1